MATTTVPEVQQPAQPAQPKTAAPVLTPSAIAKVKEIMGTQTPVPAGLRLSVVGGGCSGFQYSMAFENGGRHDGQSFRLRWSEGLCRCDFADVSGAERMSITSRRWKAPGSSSKIRT